MRRKVPQNLDTRVRSKFLWFPLSIQGEVRWLEKAAIKQIYHSEERYPLTSALWVRGRWISIKWINP